MAGRVRGDRRPAPGERLRNPHVECAGRTGRVYARYFLKSLQEKARAKATLLDGILEMDRILAARTLRGFDEAATAPLHGFESAWEYYRSASSGPVLPHVRVPTLLLHSLDDPFLPAAAVPTSAADSNPWIRAALTPRGGHVGFVETGVPWRPTVWGEAEAARDLAAGPNHSEAPRRNGSPSPSPGLFSSETV